MRKLVAVSLVLLLACVAGCAKKNEMNLKAGDYTVIIAFDKYPPVVGDNDMIIQVKDAAGKFVNDAVVKLEYDMPPMLGMPPMKLNADAPVFAAGPYESTYKANMSIPMAGSWNAVVNVTIAGKLNTAKFTVDVK
jgi:hypothetical protein